MTLRRDAKFEEKLTCGLKNDCKNFANFHQSTQKSQNWDFHDILLPSVEYVWAYNLQRSYASWKWRMVKNLEKNWLLISKLTWWIWQILIQALKSFKNLRLNGLFLTKVYNVWAKKSTEELRLIVLKIDAKLEWKLICAFKNNMRNLANFHRLKKKQFCFRNENGKSKSR